MSDRSEELMGYLLDRVNRSPRAIRFTEMEVIQMRVFAEDVLALSASQHPGWQRTLAEKVLGLGRVVREALVRADNSLQRIGDG